VKTCSGGGRRPTADGKAAMMEVLSAGLGRWRRKMSEGYAGQVVQPSTFDHCSVPGTQYTSRPLLSPPGSWILVDAAGYNTVCQCLEVQGAQYRMGMGRPVLSPGPAVSCVREVSRPYAANEMGGRARRFVRAPRSRGRDACLPLPHVNIHPCTN